MKTTIAIASSLLLLILCASCKKEEPRDKMCWGNTHNVSNIENAELRQMFYKPGTYWIYIDSMNLHTDSIYVENSGTSYISDICNNSYETYGIRLQWGTFLVVPGGVFIGTDGSVNSGTNIYSEHGNTFVMDSVYIYDRYYYNVHKTMFIPPNSQTSTVYYINGEYGFLRRDLVHVNNGTLSKQLLMRKQIIR